MSSSQRQPVSRSISPSSSTNSIGSSSSSNIQVVVRCRGRNEKEVAAKSPIVIDLPNDRYSIIDPYITINPSNSPHNTSISNSSSLLDEFNNYKTFKVDQIYGPQADQDLVFEKVVSPLFNDFLMGYNVTVLAYGQTGTGKTYTMCGNPEELNQNYNEEFEDGGLEFNDNVGIIPRVLVELFKKLNRNKDFEDNDDDFLVKCSFLELYNEDLRDLLDDDSEDNLKNLKRKLRIYEVNNESGNTNKKSIMIQNLNEEYINNFNQGFKILKRGLKKRKTASTKLNNFSSRSHTIFTINLFKKSKVNGELFKISKMNLVDLAGSENINKSGAINQRAKEAGSINQSLLTLGRVINILSEFGGNSNTNNNNLNHIPYRESKLTRLLQDSIGGSTKTTLIATISPAKINLEETLSTLDYACKAKNIKNLPINGQDSDLIMKKILVKNLSNELIRVNLDLQSTRSKNGIFLNEENYHELIENSNNLSANIKEIKDENILLKLKLKKFDAITLNNQKSIKSLSQEIDELKKSNNQLSLENTQLQTRLHSNTSKLNQFNDSFSQFMNILNENLSLSFNSIEPILTNFNDRKDSTTSNQLLKSFQNFKLNLIEKLTTIKLNLNELSTTDLPSILIEFKQLFKSLNETFVSYATHFERNITQLKQNNHQLLSYIKDSSYDRSGIDTQIEQLIKEKVSGQLSQLQHDFKTNLISLMNDHHKSYDSFLNDSIKTINQQVIENENKKLLTTSTNWFNDSINSINHLQEDYKLISSKIDHRSLIEDSKINSIIKLQDHNIQDLNKVMHLLNKDDKNHDDSISKEIMNLTKFNNSMLLSNDNLKNVIVDVNKNLTTIKNIDKSSMGYTSTSTSTSTSRNARSSLSPARITKQSSPKNSQPSNNNNQKSISSPTKENMKLISSKIPKLVNTDLPPPQKKRKILHPINH
ncbi:P-loop containing nucleoside triphosphate hydrolase protein [Scheffersomyces coipomensis]|uniref:P-loop containing nucleoside triphosphate hydrolase protein n=1 Tax=Scheffersomyces coipomensis TaxID=1788519 RepID=UPI00315D3DEA